MKTTPTTSCLRPADFRQREEALDPSRSFIIEAPAGSGKTGLLAQRYLRLLSVVERPESVVAITFTRKAAAEMKDRVINALQVAHQDLPVTNDFEGQTKKLAAAALNRDRERGWQLLMDTSRAQIQTIDSLCAMLTRQMPILSEFGGIGQVIEEATELYRLAARRTLRRMAEGNEQNMAVFRRVGLHFDNDIPCVEEQIARMLAQRDQWRYVGGQGQNQTVDDFCQLLSLAHEELLDVFRERCAVDFTEVTRAAIRALGTPDQPSDLLYWLDYRIEHLLVDEFQDTSRAQYDLLKALTEQWSEGDTHTLFLVGDPLQSIYRFREAEVTLFLHCWNERQLGVVRLNPLRLTTNFRSSPEIVGWTHKMFGPMMSEDDAVHGAIKMRPTEASRPKSKIEPRLIPFIDDKGEAEARAIVEIIKRAGDKSKIAILVRSRAHVAAILPELRKAGIRYEAVEIDELKEQQHIIDLISLTRAILHIGDRVSWFACLRAPWCGLTLSDLSALAENEPDRTILDLLSDPNKVSALSPDGRSRAVRLQEILRNAVWNVGHCSLRELVEQTWFAVGGPAILREQSQLEDAETYFELLEAFENGGTIRDFGMLNERLQSLYAKSSAGGDCVQVLTIHKAKGLEFDTVILPKIGSRPRSRERELLIWTDEPQSDGSIRLAIAAQPQKGENDAEYERIRGEMKRKDAEELKRLFYVAATRAINRLYLLGSAESKDGGRECKNPANNTFLHLIWCSVKGQFADELRTKLPVQENLFDQRDEMRRGLLRRLSADWHLPQFDASVHWEPELRRATASARKITYEWVSDTRRHVGTVVHEFLKRVAREGAASWSKDKLNSLTPVIESELIRLGVPRSEQAAASAQVLRALNNTIESERGQWILQPHAEARSEWPLGGRIKDTLISGTVDRVFRDPDGRLWIIDFKASEHLGGRLETFLDEEQRRYRAQLDNYAILMSRVAEGPIWLGLYFPLLNAWREWRFEEEVTLAANYTDF